ncbi:hypothetical protein [Natronorubrum daqingense]|uniref:Uncharacterized protein n=1 Tax=Natronorubrum daqingense TaxID=588898 RepID=A0A1N7F2Q1_9EURY|nr:hypothetical protein [Natronorubrum daqingense]APX97495.1 hypothetical protein BB347_13255 [Natronorubrum daqingense]SIR94628.1 hypothetical protein SAMN05421809_2963 [Natronorubrum daqingense]
MGNDEDGPGTANTMRERAGESRFKFWFLLRANRLVLTGLLTVAFFLAFMTGVFVDPVLSDMVAERAVIEAMFSTMISALITGITLVVTISQLIISQENGPLGDQRQRMSEALDFRTYIKEVTGKPAPADPSALLREIVDTSEKRANDLEESVEKLDDQELIEDVNDFTESITGNSDAVREQLEGQQFGTFDVVNAALDYNYSWKMFQIDRMEDDYQDVLEDEQTAAFDDLRTSLAMFGPAREHVKTLYFQWELIDLMRLILYAGIPALLVSGMMLTFVNEATVPGSTLGINNLLWLVGAAFSITLVPFLLLTTYVTRVATVAKRTLAIGPQILRKSQR